MKKAVIALALLLLLGPIVGLMTIGVLMNPAANAECTIDGTGITVGNTPNSLTATTANDETITLNGQHYRVAYEPAESSTTRSGCSRCARSPGGAASPNS